MIPRPLTPVVPRQLRDEKIEREPKTSRGRYNIHMVPKKIGLLILYFFFACNNIDAITAIIFYLKADIIIYIFLMLHIIIVISESNVKYRCITDLLQVRHAHRGFVCTKGHSFNRTCIFTNIFGNINTFNERCNELSEEGAVFVCSFSSSFGDDIINP